MVERETGPDIAEAACEYVWARRAFLVPNDRTETRKRLDAAWDALDALIPDASSLFAVVGGSPDRGTK